MTVTAVVSNVLTVTRGANGTTAATHATAVAFTKISPQMSNTSPTSDPYQNGYFTTMRSEQDLAALGLPFTANGQTEEWKDGFYMRSTGTRAALRGGNWNNASNARSGFILNLNNAPSNRNINIGFRAALSYCQKPCS